jgi:hypothetical protein
MFLIGTPFARGQNAISKFFRLQPAEMKRSDRIKVWKNLEGV